MKTYRLYYNNGTNKNMSTPIGSYNIIDEERVIIKSSHNSIGTIMNPNLALFEYEITEDKLDLFIQGEKF